MKYALLNVGTETAEAVTEETTLIENLKQYFYGSSEVYENLNMGTGSIFSVRLIIFGLCIGLALAGFAAVFNKRVLGGFVRRLLKDECLSPDSAKTVDELGYSTNLFIRLAVRKSTSLRRVVKCREEQIFLEELEQKRTEYQNKRAEDRSLPRFKEAEYKMDVMKDRFYIPEEMKYMADIKFEQKGTSWLGAVMFVVIMAIVFVAAMIALPYILDLINDAAGVFNSDPSNQIK